MNEAMTEQAANENMEATALITLQLLWLTEVEISEVMNWRWNYFSEFISSLQVHFSNSQEELAGFLRNGGLYNVSDSALKEVVASLNENEKTSIDDAFGRYYAESHYRVLWAVELSDVLIESWEDSDQLQYPDLLLNRVNQVCKNDIEELIEYMKYKLPEGYNKEEYGEQLRKAHKKLVEICSNNKDKEDDNDKPKWPTYLAQN